jgi:rhodanese-related sulfurtransferase
MARRHAAKTVDELLAQARATLPGRPSPAQALHAQASGALLIDIREDDQRRKDGLIPGAIVLPRNSLEWRCDPTPQWRHPAITRRDLRIILICNQGYQSTLAAAALQQLGLIHATDLDGGFTAWAAAGLPVIAPERPATTPPGDPHPEGPARRVIRPARRTKPHENWTVTSAFGPSMRRPGGGSCGWA